MTTYPARTSSDTRTPETKLTLSRGHVLVFEHARDVPMEFWDRGFSDSWKDFQYYDLIERTMRCGFEYRYLLVFDENEWPLALQPLLLASQDLAISAGARVARLVAKLRTQWPRFLKSRVALAGCLVGDGKMGTLESDEVATPLVAEAVEKYAGRVGIRLVGFKDFPARTRSAFSSLNQAGYVRVTGFPPLILDLNFASFEEYAMKQLSRATRKNLRRKFRAADGASPAISFEVWTDAERIIDEIYPLYLAVAETSAIQFEIFTREYFLEAGRRAPGKFRYFVWRQGSRAVAFSFCTIWDGTLYDNDIGLDYSVAYELNLYYVTFRDLLNWAVANALRRYACAPFNYDPKLRLRLQLQPVDIYVKHTSVWLNPLIKLFAWHFEPTRTDPVLRQRLHLLR
ncbi:MAG: GNAT family N-acetyltransferase [Verrucomicrobia bacterium]|nr:MAG: GNAT family N-acetyltransferase [Verrucomicrobiota bacterium]